MMAIIAGNRAAEISAVTDAISSLKAEEDDVTTDVMVGPTCQCEKRKKTGVGRLLCWVALMGWPSWAGLSRAFSIFLTKMIFYFCF